MPRRRLPITVHFLLLFLSSCSPTPQTPPTNILNVVRLSPPALVQFSEDLTPLAELPLSFPSDCGLYDIFPPPRGTILAVELSCSFGQAVLFLDAETGSVTQAFPQTDSHFLAWTANSKAIFLRVDSAASPHILRVNMETLNAENIPITELTYDLSSRPDSFDFTFTFSRGFGFGSEIFLAKNDGRIIRLLYADPLNYISFARWSPDGKQIAFIKIPDSQTPFTVGELWIMDANGSNPRKLADVDAGHGYAATWSADGSRIAFVVRENAEDMNANESADALISNIYIVDISTSEITQVTNFSEGRAETPHWSPHGNSLFFTRVLNGRMEVQVKSIARVGDESYRDPAEIKALLAEPACCVSWMRK
jgi:Tol biopolymer transport system component